MNQGNVRNKVNFSKVEPRPSNDNILSQFLGSIGSIGQGVGEAVGQVGTGIAGGIGQGVNLIGQGIGEMNKTPEGRLALRELVGAALRGVGQEDLGTGIQQYAQRVYQPEAQRALYETQQKAEAEKAERDRDQKLIDEQRKRQQQIEDALFLDLKKKEQDPKEARFKARKQASHEVLTKFENKENPYYENTKKFLKDQKVPYLFKSDEYKQIEQAQRDFVNAVLREESGAAIAESEFENAIKQYFPQPGDTAEVVKQKQINREQQFEKLDNEEPKLTGGFKFLGVE
jgi:hypothetical protein